MNDLMEINATVLIKQTNAHFQKGPRKMKILKLESCPKTQTPEVKGQFPRQLCDAFSEMTL